MVYCFSCGRRLDAAARVTPDAGDLVPLQTSVGAAIDSNGGPITTNGFAATVALANAASEPPPGASAREREGFLFWALDSLRYVFAYVRGRIDAEERKRRLVRERDGAKRLVEGTFAELGQVVRGDPASAAQLKDLLDAIARAEVKRQEAITDLAAAEKFEAADDLRLGMEQAAVEAEWRACDLSAADVDKTLRRIDDERREIDVDIARLNDDAKPADPQHRNTARAALAEKRVLLNERYASLRERAAALRASTLRTRRKLDQAIAARRQAGLAMAASLVAHARGRNEAEGQIRDLVIQLGRSAAEIRLALPSLEPTYGRVDRLEQVIADRDRQISALDRTSGRYDLPKLAAGVGLLSAITGAIGVSLWALLR